MGWVRPTGLVLSFAIAAAAAAEPSQTGPPLERVMHCFGFDERDEGNLEPVPKFWVPFEAASFPRFAAGGFDDRVGHDAPPSFRLDSEGRNVAYRYAGPATRVMPQSEYLISGWIRGSGLEHARAALSAYYVDGDRLPIRATQRFSRLVGGQREDHAWQRVDIFLPAGPPQARTIGLTAWVVQQDIWNIGPKAGRNIARYDVRARAWFDDLNIYRLPKIAIETGVPGNVFSASERPLLRVAVTDADAADLSAELDILSVSGERVRSFDVPVGRDKRAAGELIDLNELGNGLYQAILGVRLRDRPLAERRRAFAIVGGDGPVRTEIARPFGVVLGGWGRVDPMIQLALLGRLGVGAVKVPVWSGSADVPDLAAAPEKTKTLLHEMLKWRVNVTGVLAGAPCEVVRAAGAYPRSLLSLLDDDPSAWRDHLVDVVARYSSVFWSWQIGPDGNLDIASSPQLEDAIERVRREMEGLTTAPILTAPGSLGSDPGMAPATADRLSLTLNDSILPSFIAAHIDAYRDRGRKVSAVYVQPGAADGVDPLGRLRNWCKRLVVCRHAGVEATFVPQPWRRRETPYGIVVEPEAEFVILRAMIDAIGQGVPGAPVHIAGSVKALAFHRDDRTVLAMWDEQAPAAGRVYELQLGSARRAFDMWGRSIPLEPCDDGRHRIVLNHEPVYVPGVERWLVSFRSLLSVTPDKLESSIALHDMSLTIANPHHVPLEGRIRIEAPAAWDVSPRTFSFALAPQERTIKGFQAQIGRDETAGLKIVNVHVDVSAERSYTLVVPLAVTIDTGELEAWGLAYIANGRLTVRHGVANRSGEALHLRAHAIAPGRARQSRTVAELVPGRSTTLEYQFTGAESLRGRTLRLQLRELNGPRIHNLDVPVE